MRRAFAILAAGWIACTSALAASSDRPADEAAREQFYRIRQWAASRGLNIHRHNDKSAGLVLDIFERVNREHPIGALRWALVHLEDASEPTLKRMKTLGVGWALQDAGYFEGETQLKEKGAEAMKRITLRTRSDAQQSRGGCLRMNRQRSTDLMSTRQMERPYRKWISHRRTP